MAVPAAADEPDTSARTKCVEDEAPYYFHGLPLVEGTFDQVEPDPDRALQSFQSSSTYPRQTYAVWESGFTGELCGEITFTLYILAARDNSMSITVEADGKYLGGSGRTGVAAGGAVRTQVPGAVSSIDAQEFRFYVNGAVTDRLRILMKQYWDVDSTNNPDTFYYDHPDYAAGFRVSTLEPCEVNDPHPDCAFTDGLRNLVNEYANSGDVTEDGRTQLLAALNDAKTAFDSGDAEATVAALEEFKRLTLDPELVTTTAARDDLISAADTLIAALQEAEPA